MNKYTLDVKQIHNGYYFNIYDSYGALICQFLGSTNAMWDSVNGARDGEKMAKEYLNWLNSKETHQESNS